MTTEKQLQEGIKATAEAALGVDHVYINDQTMLDGSLDNAPYFVILNSDEFVGEQETVTVGGSIPIPALLIEAFEDWEVSGNAFRDNRQLIIDEFDKVGTARSAGGLEGVNIRRIRPGSPVTYITADPENPLSLPVFIVQQILFEVELF